MRTREIAEKARKKGLTPLEYMLRVLRDPRTRQERRDQMAIAAAPYMHARLQAVEHKGEGGGLVINLLQFTPGLTDTVQIAAQAQRSLPQPKAAE